MLKKIFFGHVVAASRHRRRRYIVVIMSLALIGLISRIPKVIDFDILCVDQNLHEQTTLTKICIDPEKVVWLWWL